MNIGPDPSKPSNSSDIDQKASTLFFASTSLVLGYVLVLAFTLLGEHYDLIFFRQREVYFMLIIVSLINIIGASIPAVLILHRMLGKRGMDRFNLFYLLFIGFCSISSILSLFYIIRWTGGVFFSPFTGFYAMLFSVLTGLSYMWTSKLLRVGIFVFLFLAATAATISYSCISDPLQMRFKTPIRNLTYPQNLKDAVNSFNASSSNIYGSVGYTDNTLFYYPKCLGTDADEVFKCIWEYLETKIQNKTDSTMVAATLSSLASHSGRLADESHNTKYRYLRAAVIILGILFTLILGMVERAFGAKRKPDD